MFAATVKPHVMASPDCALPVTIGVIPAAFAFPSAASKSSFVAGGWRPSWSRSFLL